jgi:uncharacterized membrane protein YfcA
MGFTLIFLSGLAAGFINVNAGGGSLITIPALIFLGVPPGIANGTNRIAILAGAATAVFNFYRKKALDIKLAAGLAAPTVAGAIAGTLLAVRISDTFFQIILSAVMVFVISIIFIKPVFTPAKTAGTLTPATKTLLGILFVAVGFYGGFIQAGVGILTIAVLSICTGYNLVKINAIKISLVLVYTIFSLTLFSLHGKINIGYGLVLAAGNAIGSHVGSSLALKKGESISKVVLLLAVVGMLAKISGLF